MGAGGREHRSGWELGVGSTGLDGSLGWGAQICIGTGNGEHNLDAS